jgi:hypothetical protein
MRSPYDAPDTDTPSTISVGTPQQQISEYDTIHVMRAEETIENHPSIQKPPKLKLKLRNLPRTVMHAFACEVPHATPTTLAFDIDNSTKNAMGYTIIQPEASQQQSHQTSLLEASAPLQNSEVKSGSANNPIEIDTIETPYPPKSHNRPSTYFAPLPLQYRPSRPKLLPGHDTPNGAAVLSGEVGSHQTHAIYQMLAARDDVPKKLNPNSVKPQIGPAVSQPGRHAAAPRSQARHNYHQVHAQPVYQTHSPNVPLHPSRSHNTYTTFYQTPNNGYAIFPKQDEVMLRKRAVQYVLDHARPRSRKRRLSDDPDVTSSSEYEDASRATKRTRKETRAPEKTPDASATNTPSSGASEENMFDRNLRLTEMVEHAQLMASLLMAYPYSADQKGMREDIAMLMTVTEKRLQTWLSAEHELDLEFRKWMASSMTSPTPSLRELFTKNTMPDAHARSQSKITVSIEDITRGERRVQQEREKEEELRRYLSADSSVWEGHTRESDGGPLTASRVDSGVAGPSTVVPPPGHFEASLEAIATPTTAGLEITIETAQYAQVHAPLRPNESVTTGSLEPSIQERQPVRLQSSFRSRGAGITDAFGFPPPPRSILRHLKKVASNAQGMGTPNAK